VQGHTFVFSLFGLVYNTGDWTQSLAFGRQRLYRLNCALAIFCFVLFRFVKIGSPYFCSDWPWTNSPSCLCYPSSYFSCKVWWYCLSALVWWLLSPLSGLAEKLKTVLGGECGRKIISLTNVLKIDVIPGWSEASLEFFLTIAVEKSTGAPNGHG
jgi:hypothetical protein